MFMNNKKLGTDFEREMCDILSKLGYWAHFIEPKVDGSQPFDIIAVKNGRAYAFDCKTCVSKTFSINRLEDNQINAFDKWIRCGNLMPFIIVKYTGNGKNNIMMIPYSKLVREGKVNLEECDEFHHWKRH